MADSKQRKASADEGTSVDSRYTLEEQLSTDDQAANGTTWLATDAVLARPVVVRIGSSARDGARLVAVATQVGAIRHSALAPILDTVSHPSRGVVREWVDARPLYDLLGEASPPPTRCVTLVRLIAEALDALHRQDLHHGHLVPANVFVRPDGRVAITDAGLHAEPAQRGNEDGIEADLDDLANILHVCLSGTWPGDPGLCPGLPQTPHDGNRLCSPRQVRAGVPRDLDAIWTRIARRRHSNPATSLRSAGTIAAALAELPSAPLGVNLGGEPDDTANTSTPWLRSRWGARLRRATPWLALAVIGSVGWAMGIAVGTLPGQGGHAGPVTIASPGASPAQEIKVVSARDFDPPPGDGHENPAGVPLAHDGDVSTAWQTDIYQGSPRLGGIKPGVGLLIDLGTATKVGAITLALPLPGTNLEIRAGDSPGTKASDYAIVASVTDAKTLVTLTPDDPTPHRYWLIWLTSLPKVADGYRGGIAEYAFLR